MTPGRGHSAAAAAEHLFARTCVRSTMRNGSGMRNSPACAVVRACGALERSRHMSTHARRPERLGVRSGRLRGFWVVGRYVIR